MSQILENFGKFVLLERLAAGGMAEVYLAKSTGAGGISKFIAIKRILPQYSEHPEFIDMFKEEAKIAVNLNHGNVVSIFEFGIEKQQFFLVMEYVEGQNLRQVLNHLKKENKNFSIDQIVYIIKEVAAGLDHAHRCLDGTTGKPLNITHRDMSPQNIMLSFEGEVKIVDFGIAKAESQMEQTRAGTIKGKFGYMSPEQADGQTVDPRTDIFSLGIVLWELLANDRLFSSNNEAATLKKIRECQIPSLRKLNPAVPPELERICTKALAKDRAVRYQNSSAFHRDLNRFINTQYPEFSPHDFSVFMKSAFSQMFIENRKKLIDYAKVQGAEPQSNVEKTVVASTETVSLELPPPAPIGLTPDTGIEWDNNNPQMVPINPNTGRINLNDLKIDKPIKKNMGNTQTGISGRTYGNGNSSYQNTNTQVRRQRPPVSNDSSNGFLYILAAILVGLGGWWTVKSGKFQLPDRNEVAQNIPTENPTRPAANPPVPVVSGQIDSASKQTYAVVIESNPPGARVFIDGQDTGMITPARKSLEANKEFTLGLRLQGFQYYERRDIPTLNGYSSKASLIPLPQMGYLDLDLVSGGSNPVVLINGQRIEEKLPLRNYAVPANTQIKIEVHNPFTGLSAERQLTVGANQRQQVNLILSQGKSIKK